MSICIPNKPSVVYHRLSLCTAQRAGMEQLEI